MLCSVLISVYNEEDNLRVLYNALAETASKEPDIDFEFIFVDDGSTDRSHEILSELHRRDPRVKVIQFSRNFGAHEATAAGIRYASGDAAVIMSADMQDPPHVINQFIKCWKEGYHMVWGVRTGRKDSFHKKFLASVFYWIVNKTSSTKHPSSGSGSFCLISRPVIDAYNRLNEHNRATFELVSWMGFKQAEVLYERPERYAGKSKFSLGKQFKTALDGLFAITRLPVRAISCFGFIIALLSITWSILIIWQWFFMGVKTTGWTSIIVSVQFLGGIILLSIGVIGEYLWRILDESRQRPLYIVMDTLGDFGHGGKTKAAGTFDNP